MKKRKVRQKERRTHEEIQHLLEEYRLSGLTQRRFAQEHGIGYSTLTYWMRQQRGGRYAKKAADWVEVVRSSEVPVPKTGSSYTLQSPRGLVLQFGPGFDRGEMEQLIHLLSAPCSP